MPQRDGPAVPRRQPVQSRPPHPGRLPPRDHVLGPRLADRPLTSATSSSPASTGRPRPTGPVARQVDHDRRQPAPRAQVATAGRLVARERPIGPHEGLLRQVLGIGGLAPVAPGDAVDEVLVMDQEGSGRQPPGRGPDGPGTQRTRERNTRRAALVAGPPTAIRRRRRRTRDASLSAQQEAFAERVALVHHVAMVARDEGATGDAGDDRLMVAEAGRGPRAGRRRPRR